MKKFKFLCLAIALLAFGAVISCEKDRSVQPEKVENYDAFSNTYRSTEETAPKKKRKKR